MNRFRGRVCDEPIKGGADLGERPDNAVKLTPARPDVGVSWARGASVEEAWRSVHAAIIIGMRGYGNGGQQARSISVARYQW